MNILNIRILQKTKKDSNKDDDDDENNLIKVINYVVLDCTFLMLSMMMMKIMVMVTLIDEKTFLYLMIMSYKQYELLSRIYRQRIL